jgi:hypothetical protein
MDLPPGEPEAVIPAPPIALLHARTSPLSAWLDDLDHARRHLGRHSGASHARVDGVLPGRCEQGRRVEGDESVISTRHPG